MTGRLVAHKNLSILPLPAGRPGWEWVSFTPRTAQARRSAASMNIDPLSTLCRRRYNVDYADLWVMPTSVRTCCSAGVDGRKRSA